MSSQTTNTRLLSSLHLLVFLICINKQINAEIFDVVNWLENPDDFFSPHDIAVRYTAHNLSRDAKRSNSYYYGRPPPGYGRPSYGYGHPYRPYKPYTSTTAAPKIEKKECGSGPYHGGPPLECMLRTECIAQGGNLGEPCGRGFSRGFCCEFPRRVGCGETTNEIHVLFRNPDYPDTTSLPFSCVAAIVPKPETCGIRIEFLDALLGPSTDGFCFQDSVTILGGGSLESNGFNTPFCGIIKGYATVVPVNQTSELVQIVVNSQSRDVMWNINVTQVHCGSLYLPFDDLCGVRNGRSMKKTAVVRDGHQKSRIPRADMTWAQDTSLFPLGPPSRPGAGEGKILGGQPVGGTQFPWMAALLYDNGLVCGATLIARQWVITAAHCVTLYAAQPQIPVKRFRVWLGSYNLSAKVERLRIVRRVERIYVHPEHEGTNYDVAVLKLNETVIYNLAIRPICFPEDPDETYKSYRGIITGWGSNGGPGYSPILLGANTPIFNNSACTTAWNSLNINIRDSMICAGDGSAATCTGDSGGPLIVSEDDGLYSLIGVAVFGAPPACGNPDYPDVFARISVYASWIALVLALPLPLI